MRDTQPTPTGSERDRKEPGADPSREKRTLAGFLVESDIKPFVFVGKCVQFFGWGAVAGFLLGVICIYGYALFKPLPYAKATEPIAQPTPTPPVLPKTVQLRGVVRDSTGRPMATQFWVGILAKQLGPVQNSEGSFALEVPPSTTYDLALWTTEKTVNVFTGFPAEQDGNGYRLQWALPFLQSVATGSAQDLRSRDLKSMEQLARSQVARAWRTGSR